MNQYSVEYQVDGRTFDFKFYAKDFDDAENHLASIANTAKSRVWQIVEVIPDTTNVETYLKSRVKERLN